MPKKPSPERAKGIINRLLRPFRACLMGDAYPGLRSASTPGYLISPLRGLRATFIFPAFARMTKARCKFDPSTSSGTGRRKRIFQSLKVQMERLQWGFPIATALSLNTPASINRKKEETLATDLHGKTRKEEKNFNLLRKQRCKWSGCSGASPSQPLCLQTHPHQ